MKKILIFFGTRPEAIKLCPLIIELKKRAYFDTKICVSGQHKEMLPQVMAIFGLKPDYDLDIMKDNQTLSDITSNILQKINDVLDKEQPDLVIVHGDTTTTFTTALASFYRNIPIGHVEAGLRTNNIKSPFPEEFNRRVVSLISDLDFCPTQLSRENLLKEFKKPENLFVTGNTGIDALKYTVRDDFSLPIMDWAKDSRVILLTSHRRENIGQPMRNIFTAIRRIAKEFSNVKVIYPIHPNPKVRVIAHDVLDGCDNIRLIEPLDVISFHNLINKSYLVVTDSGGIQEEAPSLGKPVLVARDTTERPEGVQAGTLKLVGTNTESIYSELRTLLTDEGEYARMSQIKNPYGDGNSSERIANIISSYFEGKENAENQ